MTAQKTLNSNATQPYGGPNQGQGTDQGDSWDTTISNINAMFTDIYAGTSQATAGGSAIRPSGNINAQVGPIGNNTATTAQTLATFSLPANSLDSVGRELEITAWGVFGATGTPGVSLNVGGVTGSIATASHTSLSWQLFAQYMLAGSNLENAFFTTLLNGSAACANKTDNASNASAITISCTCQDGTGTQSSVILYGFTVEYFK